MDTFTFSGKIDSKGRITVPARIRNRVGIEKGDRIEIALSSAKVLQKEVESDKEALDIISRLESVNSFEYNKGNLKVVYDG